MRVVAEARRARRGLCVGLLGVLLVGCGGSAASSGDRAREVGDASRSTSTTSATQSHASEETARSAGGPSRKSSGTTAPGDSANAVGPDVAKKKLQQPDKRTLKMSVELKHDCVRPGSAQTVTIHATTGSIVGYNTYYADGKSALHEGFYGGNMVGATGEDGTWTDTWVVAANAPAGQAVVAVLGSHSDEGHGEAGAAFLVSDAIGNCS